METHIDRPLTIAAIARRVGDLGARALETLFLKIVDASPGAYFVALRLNPARRLDARTQPSDRGSRGNEAANRRKNAIAGIPASRSKRRRPQGAVRDSRRNRRLDPERGFHGLEPRLPSIVITPSSHFVSAAGFAFIRARTAASGCMPWSRISKQWGDFSIAGSRRLGLRQQTFDIGAFLRIPSIEVRSCNREAAIVRPRTRRCHSSG